MKSYSGLKLENLVDRDSRMYKWAMVEKDGGKIRGYPTTTGQFVTKTGDVLASFGDQTGHIHDKHDVYLGQIDENSTYFSPDTVAIKMKEEEEDRQRLADVARSEYPLIATRDKTDILSDGPIMSLSYIDWDERPPEVAADNAPAGEFNRMHGWELVGYGPPAYATDDGFFVRVGEAGNVETLGIYDSEANWVVHDRWNKLVGRINVDGDAVYDV